LRRICSSSGCDPEQLKKISLTWPRFSLSQAKVTASKREPERGTRMRSSSPALTWVMAESFSGVTSSAMLASCAWGIPPARNDAAGEREPAERRIPRNEAAPPRITIKSITAAMMPITGWAAGSPEGDGGGGGIGGAARTS
jgi:hypothetical protein